jgi:hypothetical protein
VGFAGKGFRWRTGRGAGKALFLGTEFLGAMAKAMAPLLMAIIETDDADPLIMGRKTTVRCG